MIIVHISDMHFKKSIKDLDLHIQKLVDTFNTQIPFQKIIFVISGDISATGDVLEFKAADYFFRKLKKVIVSNFEHIDKNDIMFLVVPGNHDVFHSNDFLIHEDLERIYSNNEYELETSKEIDKLTNYYYFANKYNCFVSNPICEKKDIYFSNEKLSFYLINTATFSLKKEEDKGLHYINESALKFLSNVNSDYNIAVMHHSPYCYTDELKNKLISLFSEKFSLIMLGHEHYEANEFSGMADNSFIVLHAGAFFHENWDSSEFSIMKIYGNMKTIKTNFKWNKDSNQYEDKNNTNSFSIEKKGSGEMIKISSSYINKIRKDEKKSITKSFEDYFIFPRMECIDYDQKNKSKEIKNETVFFSELEKAKLIYISGNHGLGKTTLLKHIFNKLKAKKVPLLLSADDFTNKKSEKVIKNVFEEIYGYNHSDYDKFNQLSSNRKVLLIDDVDRINNNDFNAFILENESKFDYIVLTSTEKIQFDWKQSLDSKYDYREAFSTYKMTPMFKDKRKELVSVLVPLLKTTVVEDEDIINRLCDALDSQKRFVFMSPDFIIQYVDYFCKNIGDISSYDTNVFSKVFEANLTNSLAPHVTGKLNVDKMLVLISKVAYNANLNKEYPIKEKTISEVINEYNDEYDNGIEIVEFINICVNSKVLFKMENGYKFTSKNYFSYFIAREILLLYNDSGDACDIYNTINYCCFGINSDILLFIIYLSDKLAILNIILEMLKRLVAAWEEYDGKKVKIKFLATPSKVKQEFIEKNSDLVLEEQVQQEKVTEDIRDIQTIDIYDYNEEEVDDTLNKIVKATALLSLVSRAFPNFEHRIKGEQKKEIVEMLYSVPNKIFYFWANEIDNDCDEFINYFLQKNDNEYGLDSAVSESLSNLQHMSLSLLLDLYYGIVHEACKTNTYDFLNKFNHVSEYTYQSEYMLMVEQFRRDPMQLISLADKQISSGDNIAADLSRRILYHALNTMPKLSQMQRSKIASRIGLSNEAQKRIEIKRYKGAINN